MGKWAKLVFGRESFEDVGVIVGGNTPEEVENVILKRNFWSLDGGPSIESRAGFAYHPHLARTARGFHPIVFNVYGSPAVLDILPLMYDGGCRNVLFVGYAFSFNNLRVGDISLPSKAYHFDGSYQALGHEAGREAHADIDLRRDMFYVLSEGGIVSHDGGNISVTAVTLQPPHTNYGGIKPATLEMELASLYSRAREIGIRTAGALVISDTRTRNIGDQANRQIREESKVKVLGTIFRNLDRFRLPYLESDFSIDSCLASIVEMPDEEGNAYRK